MSGWSTKTEIGALIHALPAELSFTNNVYIPFGNALFILDATKVAPLSKL